MERKAGATAADVVKALARRHAEDMFFREVKDGPTQVVSHYSRIDALAIKISWTRFNITGYEVKVSHADFMRDDKWRSYLPMCNQLYFAAPVGVIPLEEVPEHCGLIQYTAKGGLRTVRKAPWRDIEPPVEMYKYLMFTYIGAYGLIDHQKPRWARLLPGDGAELYQAYAEGRLHLEAIGRKAGEKLSRELRELRYGDTGQYREHMEAYRSMLVKIRKALGLSEYFVSDDKDVLTAIRTLKRGCMTEADITRVLNLAEEAAALAEGLKLHEGGTAK